jgi:hypothetical protein
MADAFTPSAENTREHQVHSDRAYFFLGLLTLLHVGLTFLVYTSMLDGLVLKLVSIVASVVSAALFFHFAPPGPEGVDWPEDDEGEEDEDEDDDDEEWPRRKSGWAKGFEKWI